jgi:hypothetical protein
MIVDMKAHKQTDEPETDAWEPLAAANTRILTMFHGKQISEAVAAAALSHPHEQKDEQGDSDSHRGDAEKQKDEDQRAYVAYGLKQIAEFERCARGLEAWPRRRRRC